MRSKNSRRDERSIRAIRIVSESPLNLPIIRTAIELLREIASPIEIILQEGIFLGDILQLDELLATFVQQRLVDPKKRDARAYDSFALHDFERRVLTGQARARGVPYEGEGLRKRYQKLLGKTLNPPAEICVIITDRLIMTWSEDERRYHARAVVFGLPGIISISGLVEAPARSREYYIAKRTLASMGMASGADRVLSEEFAGRYLEAEDPRFPAVLRGYLLQCLFYAHCMKPFCESKDCMLFNAHWHEEMIRAQIDSGRLCSEHESQLQRIRKGEAVGWLSNE